MNLPFNVLIPKMEIVSRDEKIFWIRISDIQE